MHHVQHLITTSSIIIISSKNIKLYTKCPPPFKGSQCLFPGLSSGFYFPSHLAVQAYIALQYSCDQCYNTRMLFVMATVREG